MGFTTGFTGGVTLTLSVAYLTALAHQRNREQQGQALRAQALAIQGLIDPLPVPLPPTRSEVAASQRATTVEVAKDRWNHEIENAVKWAQQTDWAEVREDLEESASRLWARATGQTIKESGRAAVENSKPIAREAKVKADEAAGGVASVARSAFSRARETSQDVETAAENKVLEARLRAKKAASETAAEVERESEEAKGALASALDRGREKAREIVDLAKTTVGVAEDKVTILADGKVLPATNAVEKALHQRYEKPSSKHNKTVAQALQERYMPIDQRDNTVLRGV